MRLQRIVSASPEGGSQLRTWISHTVPHMTLMSLTTDSIPGLNWLLVAGVGVASIVAIGRALREISAAHSRSSTLTDGINEGQIFLI